jgi:sugar O-acyltransferase (sialic acid O-acetyltransferase NeuD family)
MICVLGSGGHAKVLISTLRALGYHNVVAFDDDPARHGCAVLGVTVRGPISDAKGPAILAIGSNLVREKLSALLLDWMTLVHPSAVVDESVRLGVGTVVLAGAVIQPETVVGRHAVINTRASVDHDCRIGDFAFIAPGATLAGTVSVGTRSFVGTGASVIPNVTIGADVVVGAGAAVVRDLLEPGTYVGCPAKLRG